MKNRKINFGKACGELNVSASELWFNLLLLGYTCEVNPNEVIPYHYYDQIVNGEVERIKEIVDRYNKAVQIMDSLPKSTSLENNLKLPDKLYKYYACKDYNLSSLAEEVIFHSDIRTFNDPFDGHEMLVEFNRNEEFRIYVRQAIERTGVSCFTTIKENLLMWAHYADNHTGFVVEYDTRKLPLDLYKVNYVQHFAKVHFQDSSFFESITRIMGGECTHNPNNLDLIDERKNVAAHLLLTKGKVWSYENEWRSIKHIPHPDVEKVDDARKIRCAESITGVYLGARMNEADYHKIVNVLKPKRKSIKVFKATVKHGEYALNFKRLKML